jgi:hypothetical protein
MVKLPGVRVTKAGGKHAPLHPHLHSALYSPESHSPAAEKAKGYLLVREAELHMEADTSHTLATTTTKAMCDMKLTHLKINDANNGDVIRLRTDKWTKQWHVWSSCYPVSAEQRWGRAHTKSERS